MSKTSVSKVLNDGSAKQRALLLANHIADVSSGGKGLLTESELSSLTKSFQKPNEIELYNRYCKIFEKVQIYLTTLSQLRLSYLECLGRLDKLILLKRDSADIEDLTNSLLSVIKDKPTRSKALKVAKHLLGSDPLRKIQVDKDGFIKVSLGALEDEQLTELRNRIQSEQIKLKTAIRVIKDYFDETGFNVKMFKEFVKNLENWAKGKTNKGLSSLLIQRSLKEAEDSRAKELIEKNLLELDYESVEIDEAEYKQLRGSYLDA